MIHSRLKRSATALLLGMAGLCATAQVQAAAGYTITEVMSGLVTPRGLAFAPDGSLYVTEVGRGGGVGAPSLGWRYRPGLPGLQRRRQPLVRRACRRAC